MVPRVAITYNLAGLLAIWLVKIFKIKAGEHPLCLLPVVSPPRPSVVIAMIWLSKPTGWLGPRGFDCLGELGGQNSRYPMDRYSTLMGFGYQTGSLVLLGADLPSLGPGLSRRWTPGVRPICSQNISS